MDEEAEYVNAVLEVVMSSIGTNRFSVGNGIVDSAHKDILNIVFRIAYLIGKRDGAALKENFVLLENKLCAYFEIEEKLAQAISHDFSQHKLTHLRLLNDFQCIKNILESKNCMWAEEEGEFFTNSWAKGFVQHIKDDGMPAKAMLDTHYFDCQPA